MSAKRRPPLPQTFALNRLSGGLPRQFPLARKRKTSAWLQGRRPATQPWKRGRIRPSSCHDLAGKATPGHESTAP
jgi:hypothetical protein